MRTILKNGAQRLIENLLDTIVAFSDYFVIRKRVTLSETTLFFFSFSWAVWFLAEGVYVAEMALARSAWVTIFLMMTVAHFCTFLFDGIKARAYVVSLEATVFCFLALLTAYTGSITPAFPTLAVLTFLSVFIAVRLFRGATTTWDGA